MAAVRKGGQRISNAQLKREKKLDKKPSRGASKTPARGHDSMLNDQGDREEKCG